MEGLLVVPGPEYGSEHVAEFPQPADLGCVRGLDLRNGFGAVLVHRLGSGSGYAARSRNHQGSPMGVWISCSWLARIGAALAALRSGVPDSGGDFKPAVFERPSHRQLRLRDFGHPRLAYHDLPAVLCCRRDFLGFRLCDDAADYRALGAESSESDHDEASRKHE